jgi:hypothetical protein
MQYNSQKKKDMQYNSKKKKDMQYNSQKKKDIQYNSQKKKGKGQTIMYKTLHTKQKIEQHELYIKTICDSKTHDLCPRNLKYNPVIS